MNKRTGFLAVAIIALAGSGSAIADVEAGQSYFSIMGSFIDDDKDRGVDDEFNGGQLGLGYAINENWNIEAIRHARPSNPDLADVARR